MPLPLEHPRRIALAALVALGGAPSCTVFDGLRADGGYLDTMTASRLCARIAGCPSLGPSIRVSLGVPADDASFSACLSWLAGPVPAPAETVSALRPTLTALADAASCEDALALLSTEAIAPNDPRCASGEDACLPGGAGAALDCSVGILSRCDDPLFEDGSACSYDALDPPIGPKLPPSARCRVEACPFPNNPSCAGDSLEVCDLRANAKQRFQCGAIGLKCVEVEGPTTASNIAFCATPGVHETSCQEQAQSGATCTLDGKSIVLCSREGHFRNPMAEEVVFSAVQSVYTCPEGWACEGASDVSSFAYCRSLEGCSPQDTRDRGCDGASVEVCLGGRLRTIDCAEGGMVCRDDQGRGAWCVFP